MVLNHCLVGNVAPSPWDPGARISISLRQQGMGEQKKERNQKESRRKRHREIVAEREKKRQR